LFKIIYNLLDWPMSRRE